MTHLVKIDVGWDLGGLGIELDSLRECIAAIKKDFGATSIFEASDAKLVKIIVGSFLEGLGSTWVFIGRAVDD